MIPKPKRKVDRELLDSYQGRPCVACKSMIGTVAHHIKTRGSGGHDVVDNLIALCVNCHTEIHQIGTYTFFIKYPWAKK